MIITAKQLERAGACEGGVRRFRRVFGASAEVTPENCELAVGGDISCAFFLYAILFDSYDIFRSQVDFLAFEMGDKPACGQAWLNSAYCLILLDIVAGMEEW